MPLRERIKKGFKAMGRYGVKVNRLEVGTVSLAYKCKQCRFSDSKIDIDVNKARRVERRIHKHCRETKHVVILTKTSESIMSLDKDKSRKESRLFDIRHETKNTTLGDLFFAEKRGGNLSCKDSSYSCSNCNIEIEGKDVEYVKYGKLKPKGEFTECPRCGNVNEVFQRTG